MNIRNNTLNYRGIEISYFIRPGNEKTLLYLHGGACSSDDFRQATKREELKAYTIVGIDFPGCGESPYPENEVLTIDDLMEITRNIIQHLNLHNITLIGHSMGGLVSLKYIVKYGGIDAFVSVEGNLAPENCVFSRKVVATKDADEFEKNAWLDLKKDLKNSNNRGFQQWGKTIEKNSAKAFYDYCAWIVKNSDDPNTFNEYLNLTIPRIYIYGSENKENLTFLKRLNAEGYQIAEIPNSNHFPFYDNPEKFYAVIMEFLAAN